MNSVKNHHIEQFIRFPEELSREEFEYIQKYISENEEAHQLAVWYREYYQEFDILNRPVLFKLSIKKVSPTYSGSLVLAAMSETKPQKGLVTRATFSSDEESTLVRVLEDMATNKFQFHVLSRFINDEDRVLIGFGNSGVELITNKGGKLRNIEQDTLSGIHWNEALLLLRFPISTCSYNPERYAETISVCEDCTLTILEGKCTFSTHQEEMSRILVEQEDQTRIFHISVGSFSFPVVESKPFTVYLYQ